MRERERGRESVEGKVNVKERNKDAHGRKRASRPNKQT